MQHTVPGTLFCMANFFLCTMYQLVRGYQVPGIVPGSMVPGTIWVPGTFFWKIPGTRYIIMYLVAGRYHTRYLIIRYLVRYHTRYNGTCTWYLVLCFCTCTRYGTWYCTKIKLQVPGLSGTWYCTRYGGASTWYLVLCLCTSTRYSACFCTNTKYQVPGYTRYLVAYLVPGTGYQLPSGSVSYT